ncbi:MAG: hypothetical protein ACI8ZB_003580 [Desulforhopalus sp.]|jgi:hypothetical protein
MAKLKRSLLQSPVLKIGTGILLASLLGLLFLPQLSSTSWFTGKAKQIINEKIPGSLDFSTLTLSWLHGLEIHEVVYKDPDQGIGLKVTKISTSKGLLALATNYKDAGIIHIDTPKAVVYLRKLQRDDIATEQTTEGSNRETSANTDSQEQISANEKQDTQTKPGPLLPQIHIQLQISEGSLVTVSPDDTQKTIVEDLNLTLNLDGKKGIVDYLLSMQDQQGKGKITGEGKIILPEDTTQGLDALQSNAVVEIRNWQIADMLTIAASQASAPIGEGILNGTLHISGSTASAIEITGNLSGQKIKLSGGPLQSDTPSIDEFTIALNLQKKSNTLEIEKFEFHSPLITGAVRGATEDERIRTLTATAKVNIAEIFSQFPATLNLKKGVSVSEGTIDIKTDLALVGSDTNFDANAHLTRLIGSAGKKNISWKTPIDILVQGKQSPETLTLDLLKIESSFLQAKGSGDSETMQLNLAADIGAALLEVEKFIDLNGWSSDGALDLNLLVGGDNKKQRDIKGDIKVANFKLSQNGKVISPADTLTATLASQVKLNSDMLPLEMSNTKIDFASWLGSGTISAERFIPETDTAPAVLKNGVAKGTFNLERITTLLHSLESLPQDESLSGSMQLSLRLTGENIKKPTLLLSSVVSPFSYQKGEKSLKDDKITIDLEADTDLVKQSFKLKNFKLTSNSIGLQASGALQPVNNEQVISSTGTTRFNLKALSELLTSFADLQLEMDGLSEKPFALKASSTKGTWTDTANHAEFSTSLHADTIKGYGLSIEGLDLPVQLKDSLLNIELKAQVNKGAMQVKPRIDFTSGSPVATLPDNSTILKEVGLTGDMSNDLLSKVHPLFKGVANTAGTISLDMQHLKWPMDKELQKDVTFAGTFTFNDVKLQAGALLTPLLAIMNVKHNEIQISNQPMIFTGVNERVTCSALEATVNEYSLILEGSVGFDQSLDYTAKLPVTRKMVSGDVYKYLEGTFITVPITGTVSKPSISKSFVQKALGDLVLQAGKKQLGDQAGKLLQKLFN